ncbi:MAG: pyruvate, phosphate dikinase, partial [Myxococcales bacterium]|nr:pyruvate, phosphate dikinase [Myxococcales bacterium]
MKRWYGFANGVADGDRNMRDLLGGKGANLAEMAGLGIPVPPGFTLPTELGLTAVGADGALRPEVVAAIDEGVAFIEQQMGGPRLGDEEHPLLVSVRSGARVSMPGMMDTVLDLGLNDATVEGLAKRSGSRRFAFDAYRRLIQMYGDVVMGIDRGALEAPLLAARKAHGARFDHELDAAALEAVVAELRAVYERAVGGPFPQDPREQVQRAVTAVFASWHGKRAVTYRKLNGIPHDWGTAANVQAMVFGNAGPGSATGVAFSRDPSTGEAAPMGEWLPDAQGEDVVAGVRTPGPLHARQVDAHNEAVGALEARQPKAYAELLALMAKLEAHFGDMQDVEFTIQEEHLFILQTRAGKRTAAAALRIAVEMVDEGRIDEREAVSRLTPAQLDQLLHPRIDPKAQKTRIANGLAASPGAAWGHIALDPDDAEARAKAGEVIILVREETSSDDIHGMHAAAGILAATGGVTSHAAVVARGMGRPCVTACA